MICFWMFWWHTGILSVTRVASFSRVYIYIQCKLGHNVQTYLHLCHSGTWYQDALASKVRVRKDLSILIGVQNDSYSMV